MSIDLIRTEIRQEGLRRNNLKSDVVNIYNTKIQNEEFQQQKYVTQYNKLFFLI